LPRSTNISFGKEIPISPQSLPLWATEETLQQLVSSLGGRLNKTNQNINNLNNQNTKNSKGIVAALTNFSNSGMSGVFDQVQKKLTKSSSALATGMGVVGATLTVLGKVKDTLYAIDDNLKSYRTSIQDLSKIGIGLNAEFSKVAGNALNAGMNTEDFSDSLIQAGRGLQILSGGFTDVYKAQTTSIGVYGTLINKFKQATSAAGYLGLTIDEINELTSQQLELSRLQQLQDNLSLQEIQNTVSDTVVELARAATEYSRQTNADRRELVQTVAALVGRFDVTDYLRNVGPDIAKNVELAFLGLQAGLPNQDDILNGFAKLIANPNLNAGLINELRPLITRGGIDPNILEAIRDAAVSGNQAELVESFTNFRNQILTFTAQNSELLRNIAQTGDYDAQTVLNLANNITQIDEFTGKLSEIQNISYEKAATSFEDMVIRTNMLRREIDSLLDAATVASLSLGTELTSAITELIPGIDTTGNAIETLTNSYNDAKNFMLNQLEVLPNLSKEEQVDVMKEGLGKISSSLDQLPDDQKSKEVQNYLDRVLQAQQNKDLNREDVDKLLSEYENLIANKQAGFISAQNIAAESVLDAQAISNALVEKTLNVNIKSADEVGFFDKFSNIFSIGSNTATPGINNVQPVTYNTPSPFKERSGYEDLELRNLQTKAFTAMVNMPNNFENLIQAIMQTDSNQRLEEMKKILSKMDSSKNVSMYATAV